MKKTLCLLFLVSILFGCDDMSMTINLSLPEHEPLLVVNATAEADNNIKVYITNSIDPLSSDFFEYIDDAVVLLKGEQLLDTLMFDSIKGYYLSNEVLEAGRNYQIEVNHSDFSTVFSEVYVPYAVQILAAELGAISDYFRAFEFKIEDPLAEDDFYLLRMKGYVEGYGWEGLWFESSEPSFDNKDFWEESFDGRKILFNDQLFNGTNKTFYMDIDFWEELDSVKIVLHTVSESFYKYHMSRRLQNQNGPSEILGAEPVVVYSNIQNGFGIFSATAKADFIITTD